MIPPLPDPASFPIKHLTREEFDTALRKGQGRAYLHVQRYGLDDVADLVLEACLQNQIFDVDLENLRGDWLFAMFRDTPHLPKFRDAILTALKTETNDRNLWQLCELGACIAALGDGEVREALHTVVLRFASDPKQDWSIGAGDWLELNGPTGMLELAKIYGQRLLADPEDNVYAALPFIADDLAYLEILRENSAADPAIQTYLAYMEAEQKRIQSTEPIDREKAINRTKRRIRKQYKLAEILAYAKTHFGPPFYRFISFGRYALPNELEQVYSALINETDDAVQARLLWVFRRAKLPEVNERLIRWASEGTDDLRFAAIAALSRVSDERIHRLAQEKVRAGALLGADSEALGLFLNNYETGDARLIIESLAPLHPNPNEADDLEFAIIALAEKYADPALQPAVLWAYENTPCAFGRSKAIGWLHDHQLLPDEIRFECQYDSEIDNREYVENITQTKKEGPNLA